MKGRKYWFVTINCAIKNKVKLTGDTALATEGVGDVSINRWDGKQYLIKGVMYILGPSVTF